MGAGDIGVGVDIESLSYLVAEINILRAFVTGVIFVVVKKKIRFAKLFKYFSVN